MIASIYRKNADELAKEGVSVLASAIKRILQKKKNVVLAIPGGRSVKPLWKLLADDARIPWKSVRIFMADERAVPPAHQDSNYRLAYGSFLKRLIDSQKLLLENVHPFIPKETKDKGCGSYYSELKKIGGKADIIILGAGEDGHVGALYPNHHSVKDDSEGYIAMNDSPKPPAERITMSRKLMAAADAALLLFIGEGKRDAYRKFKAGDDVIECPARLAKKIKNAYVLTDLSRTTSHRLVEC